MGYVELFNKREVIPLGKKTQVRLIAPALDSALYSAPSLVGVLLTKDQKFCYSLTQTCYAEDRKEAMETSIPV